MVKSKLNESFDLEDERDALLKAADYKCKLRRSDIEEALEPADLIEDMEYIYNKLCGKYDDVNIKYWRFTTDGIMVRKSDGQVVRIEDDDFDKFYNKGITESWKKGDRVVLSTGETGTVYKDFDWQNEDQVAVQIDGMDKIKYPLSDTITALRESNELEKRAKHHRKHQDGMSPFCSLGESLEVYNGTNIADFDYSNIDLDNSREIGLHCGTEQACKDKGYKCINKLNISNENILALDTDMVGYWSDPAILKHLTSVFSDSEISALRKKMGAFSGEETGTKYKNYSKIIRDALLDKGYNVISYPNSVEDVGSTSYIILDSSIISKPMVEAKKKKKHICDLGGNTLSEGIWAYQTYIDRKPGEKQPSKTLMYGGNFVTSRSPYRKEQFGADWKRHIRKIIDWSTENNPSLHRMTQSYRLDNFGKNANSEEAYISAIEDGIKKGNYELLAEGVSVLQEFKKRKKKKGIDSINTNAGNVEYNNAVFNHMNNAAESPSTNPTGPMGESVDNVRSTYKENYPNYKGIYIVWKIFLHDGISNRWIRYAEGTCKRDSTAMKYAQSALAKIYSDNKAYSVQDFHDVENEYESPYNPCEEQSEWGYYLTRCLEPDIYYYTDEDDYILGEDWWRVTFDYIDTTMEESITNKSISSTSLMEESIDDVDDSFDWSIYDYGDSDDYMDDYEYSNTYGGDLTYCPICNRKLSYDEDGDTYCDNCGESTWSLVQKRRELDKSDIDEDVDGNSDFNAYAPQFGSTASKFMDGVNTVKNLGKTQIQ